MMKKNSSVNFLEQHILADGDYLLNVFITMYIYLLYDVNWFMALRSGSNTAKMSCFCYQMLKRHGSVCIRLF